MNLAELSAELDRHNASADKWPWPDLGNLTNHDGYGIDQHHGQWRVFERERGVILSEEYFASENAACRHMLNTVLAALAG